MLNHIFGSLMRILSPNFFLIAYLKFQKNLLPGLILDERTGVELILYIC